MAAKVQGDPKIRQLQIVHLSDIHFGPHHHFRAELGAEGKVPKDAKVPSLFDVLAQDLQQALSPDLETLVCITGDIAEKADILEFEQAEAFIKKLADYQIGDAKLGRENLFLVPGNHDVTYASPSVGVRWQQWAEFYNRVFDTRIRREEPLEFARVIDRSELGAIVVCLNSCIFVEKDTSEQDRGRIDDDQIKRFDAALSKIPESRRKAAIKIALVHHHPILIPALVEPGKSYDAIHNSAILLNRLRRHGFHLVLHGHKHLPSVFTDDLLTAFHKIPEQPIFLAAGGSVGSRGLPDGKGSCNTYGVIKIAWHPDSAQWRVRHETRGLDRFDPMDNTRRLADDWAFQQLAVVDRFFYPGSNRPPVVGATPQVKCEADKQMDEARQREYERLRGNLPVIEVLPSLIRGQVYEARFWIVGHNRRESDRPVSVTWRAGPRFPSITVKLADDKNFAASFAYWGPMMVQALLTFADGKIELAYIYARLPGAYPSAELRPAT